jgi:hypothetical protein
MVVAGCVGGKTAQESKASPTETDATPGDATEESEERDLSWYQERRRELESSVEELGETELESYLDRQLELIERLIGWIEEDEASGREVAVDVQLSELSLLVDNLERNVALIEKNRELDAQRPEKTVDVSEVEAPSDGEAIQRAIAEAKELGAGAVVSLPSGTYRTNGIEVKNAADLSIVGEEDTELVHTTRDAALKVENSQNVRIENLSIDYDPLPFTQGEIVSVDVESNRFEMEIDEGFPEPTREYFREARYWRGTRRDPETGRLIGRSDPMIREAEQTGENRYAITVMDNQERDRPGLVAGYEPGQYFVVNARAGGRPAVVTTETEYVTFEDVDIHASYSHAFLGSADTGLKLIRVSAVPKPGTDRLAASNADGFHTGDHTIGPYLEGCRTKYINDDSIPVYTQSNLVAAQEAPDEIVAGPRNRRWEAGQYVQVIDGNDGSSIGVRKVESVEHGRMDLSGDTIEISRLTLDEGIDDITTMRELGKGDRSPRDYFAGSPEDEDAEMEAMLLNLSNAGTGFVIRNCRFGNHRANGMRLRSTNGIVEGNTIEDVTGLGMLVNSGLNWIGGNIPRNILIRENTMDAGIRTEHTLPYGRQGKTDQLRRIYILDNTFEDVEDPFDFQDPESVIRRNNTIQ